MMLMMDAATALKTITRELCGYSDKKQKSLLGNL